MLDCDFAAILLAQQDANDRTILLTKSVPCDIVGDGKKNERVKDSLKLGTLLIREKRVGGGRGSHDEVGKVSVGCGSCMRFEDGSGNCVVQASKGD